MVLFAIALMFLTGVLLIVSLTYIITTQRTKERLALLEKGHDPREFFKDRFFLNAVKAGFVFVGVGLGFLSALTLDEYVLTEIDNPAIYPACIIAIAGISLLLFYTVFKQKDSTES